MRLSHCEVWTPPSDSTLSNDAKRTEGWLVGGWWSKGKKKKKKEETRGEGNKGDTRHHISEREAAGRQTWSTPSRCRHDKRTMPTSRVKGTPEERSTLTFWQHPQAEDDASRASGSREGTECVCVWERERMLKTARTHSHEIKLYWPTEALLVGAWRGLMRTYFVSVSLKCGLGLRRRLAIKERVWLMK